MTKRNRYFLDSLDISEVFNITYHDSLFERNSLFLAYMIPPYASFPLTSLVSPSQYALLVHPSLLNLSLLEFLIAPSWTFFLLVLYCKFRLIICNCNLKPNSSCLSFQHALYPLCFMMQKPGCLKSPNATLFTSLCLS